MVLNVLVDHLTRDVLYSFFTMFEETLAPPSDPSRLLRIHCNEFYGLFFLTYKASVGFAVLKVISAVQATSIP